MTDELAARLDAIERQMATLNRRFGEPRRRDKRDGRAVLAVRVGDELAALVRGVARQRGCTIADLLRPAILRAVNEPQTQPLAPLAGERLFLGQPRKMPAALDPKVRARISTSLADQARLTAADAATTEDRRSRDYRARMAGAPTDAALVPSCPRASGSADHGRVRGQSRVHAFS